MRRLGLGRGVIVGVMVACFSTAASATLISQGYAVKSPIPTGALVSISSTEAGTAIIADLKNQDKLFGVAVVSDTALLSISGGTGEIQVASSGLAPVLVSTEGGAIKRGDHLGVSTIAGVARKATSGSRTIGTAADDFDGSAAGVDKRKLETTTGSKEVSVGQIPVDIGIGNYQPNGLDTGSVVPTWLQTLSNTVAGKVVSPIRAVVATTILITAIISVSVLLYGAVRTSIISIGRNPLAKNSVFKGLAQVIIIVVVILGIAAVISYLVVTK